MAGYGKALAVMVIATFTMAAFYGSIAPGIQPVFAFIKDTAAVGAGSPFDAGIINDITFIVFILAPMIVLLAAYLLPIVIAVRREVFFGRR